MGDRPSLFGLDPLWPQAVTAAPSLERRPEADHVQERLLAAKSPDGRAVVSVEVAVDGDTACLRERDRLLDLPTLEIALLERRLDHDRRSRQIGRYAQRWHGRSACSVPR